MSRRVSSAGLITVLLPCTLTGGLIFLAGCGKLKALEEKQCLLTEPVEPGELVINRLCYLLLDGSDSVRRDWDRIESVVERGIVDRAGVGDWLYAFRLQSTLGLYDEHNILFGPDGDTPKVREALAKGRVSSTRLTAECSDSRELRRELDQAQDQFHRTRAHWRHQVQGLSRNGHGGTSGYLASLEYLAARFTQTPKALSRHLFIVGDMRESPVSGKLASGAAARALRERLGPAFAGVQVRILRPSGALDDEGERSWREYFAALGARDVRFYYLGEEQTAGLEPSSVPTLGHPAIAATP